MKTSRNDEQYLDFSVGGNNYRFSKRTGVVYRKYTKHLIAMEVLKVTEVNKDNPTFIYATLKKTRNNANKVLT